MQSGMAWLVAHTFILCAGRERGGQGARERGARRAREMLHIGVKTPSTAQFQEHVRFTHRLTSLLVETEMSVVLPSCHHPLATWARLDAC